MFDLLTDLGPVWTFILATITTLISLRISESEIIDSVAWPSDIKNVISLDQLAQNNWKQFRQIAVATFVVDILVKLQITVSKLIRWFIVVSMGIGLLLLFLSYLLINQELTMILSIYCDTPIVPEKDRPILSEFCTNEVSSKKRIELLEQACKKRWSEDNSSVSIKVCKGETQLKKLSAAEQFGYLFVGLGVFGGLFLLIFAHLCRQLTKRI